MVIKKSLSSNGKVKISKHFAVYETGSTSPNPYVTNQKIYSDETMYDTDLVDKLENLFDYIGAESAYVSSWYRTPEHDKDVGGNGKGQHTLGKAVDIRFIKNGRTIDTRILSCIAQDLGFKGIARISTSYIHLDMRASGTYYGDEMKGHTNTVTNNFRSYFDISDSTIQATLGIKLTTTQSETNVSYLPKYEGTSTSIINALNTLKIDSGFSSRKKIAQANGISNYTGTAAQNIEIVNLLKTGKCIKP
jgi:hypothetical protein